MLHTKVHGNQSTGSKEDFKAFYQIWSWKPSGHVTNIILTYFHYFILPKILHTKLVKKVKWFLRETSFYFDM